MWVKFNNIIKNPIIIKFIKNILIKYIQWLRGLGEHNKKNDRGEAINLKPISTVAAAFKRFQPFQGFLR